MMWKAESYYKKTFGSISNICEYEGWIVLNLEVDRRGEVKRWRVV